MACIDKKMKPVLVAPNQEFMKYPTYAEELRIYILG